MWNEEFALSLSSSADTINLLCYDEDIIVDDFIGVATLSIDLTKPTKDFKSQYIDVFRKNKKTAEILIETKVEHTQEE